MYPFTDNWNCNFRNSLISREFPPPPLPLKFFGSYFKNAGTPIFLTFNNTNFCIFSEKSTSHVFKILRTVCQRKIQHLCQMPILKKKVQMTVRMYILKIRYFVKKMATLKSGCVKLCVKGCTYCIRSLICSALIVYKIFFGIFVTRLREVGKIFEKQGGMVILATSYQLIFCYF